MPTREHFTSADVPRLSVIDFNSVVGLAISPFEEDLLLFQRMFDEAGCELLTAHTRRQAMAELSRRGIAVVICERHLIDGNWKDVLSCLAPILNPPRLVVVARRSDPALWTEVLNMGGFDLLSAPLHELEVVYTVGSAALDWIEAEQHDVHGQPLT